MLHKFPPKNSMHWILCIRNKFPMAVSVCVCSFRERPIFILQMCISCTQKCWLHRIQLELVFSTHKYRKFCTHTVCVCNNNLWNGTRSYFHYTCNLCMCIDVERIYYFQWIGHHRYTKTQCCTNNAYITWKMCQTKRFRRHIGILGILKLYPSPIWTISLHYFLVCFEIL